MAGVKSSKRDDQLRTLLVRTTTGYDPNAAMELIRAMRDQLLAGLEIRDRPLLEYLLLAVDRIVKEGKTPDVAFGFKRARGRPPGSLLDRDLMAAAAMIVLMRKGKRWQDAKGDVATVLFGRDDGGEKAVEKAYAKYRDAFQAMADSELKETAAGNPGLKKMLSDRTRDGKKP